MGCGEVVCDFEYNGQDRPYQEGNILTKTSKGSVFGNCASCAHFRPAHSECLGMRYGICILTNRLYTPKFGNLCSACQCFFSMQKKKKVLLLHANLDVIFGVQE